MASKRKKSSKQNKKNKSEVNLESGIQLLKSNSLFSQLNGHIVYHDKESMGKESGAVVDSRGYIYVNKDLCLTPKQWAYSIAHCLLHLAFGHFDDEKMPGYEITKDDGIITKKTVFNKFLWNEACDIYIAKFLADIKFGEARCNNPADVFPGSLTDELKIYDYLVEHHFPESGQIYGTAAKFQMDMRGLEHPMIYDKRKNHGNQYTARFAYALAHSVSQVVSTAGGHTPLNEANTNPTKAAKWFIDHYPLLGGLASSFSIIEDYRYCMQNDIHVAAIDVTQGEIYVNPTCGFSKDEWCFVLAHEYLHAGLQHRQRRQGRDHYLWNVACDYVINGWLCEMKIGEMPSQGLLFDESLKGISAEEIYDTIQKDLRKYAKLSTFRGYGKGDIMGDRTSGYKHGHTNVTLVDFYREALQQGLEYHTYHERGLIPAGLVQEIRALSMPPIPWEVKLVEWFDLYFAPLEKHRSYARPSRRQNTTPDIPRARYVCQDIPVNSRTFGVVVDTSGSMSAKLIGMALGSIASYAAAKEVPLVRVVFCDASAYDAGYLAPEEIAGRVNVKGRGGTILQPGMDLLEQASDFPKDGPVLIITDGMIEEHMHIKQEHAFLIPKGSRLPFRSKGPVFYFEE